MRWVWRLLHMIYLGNLNLLLSKASGRSPLLFFLIIFLGFLVNGCSSVRETKRPDTNFTIGYHVQLIQTSDKLEAESCREEAIAKFDEDVYFLFEAPFYKVRVGDFMDIEQAEILQKLAVQKGFQNAWLVRGKVDLRKVPPNH